MQHSMTSEILESYQIQFAIDGLTSWLGQTGLADDVARIAVEELAEKFGIIDTELEEILAVQK